jgi:hypothetical protein
MRRRNLKQAFVGEGNPHQEGLEVEQESLEEVTFDVVGGQVAFVVPPGTHDDEAFAAQTYAHAELLLENGMRIRIGIHQDSDGAEISTTPAGKAVETQPDLSTASAEAPGEAE